MRIRIHYLVRLLIFWMLFFFMYRVLFMVYHFEKLPPGDRMSTLPAFFSGYRLDISAACYLMVVPFLLWSTQQFFKSRYLHKFNHAINSILITGLSGLGIAGVKMYGEWGTLLGNRAFVYLQNPGEVISFVTIPQLLALLTAWAVYAGFSLLIYWSIVRNFSFARENKGIRAAFICGFVPLIVVGMRGGIQLSPVNESFSWYSQYVINNHIATNNLWYLAHSIVEGNPAKNPYEYYSGDEARKIVGGLLPENPSGEKVILSDKPNIVLFILESWTADILETAGGEKGVTPFLSGLSKQGIVFTGAYSSGFRTEQGLASILSGIPAQPDQSIVTVPSKTGNIPGIAKQLKTAGYVSSLYYGGDIEFANMKMYLLNCGFEKIIDRNGFSEEQMNSKWGAHDGYVMEKNLGELRSSATPFLSAILTLSTHEPFEVPEPTPFTGEDESSRFRGAAWYTDRCIKKYMEKAKKEKWYANTLFVFIADHGHRLPLNRDMNLPESRKITFLLYGDVLKPEWKGKAITAPTAQHDVPAILLDQLGLDRKQFKWSKNTLDSSVTPFAYYSNENVLGWISPGSRLAWSFVQKKAYFYSADTTGTEYSKTLRQARAFLQVTYEDYLSY